MKTNYRKATPRSCEVCKYAGTVQMIGILNIEHEYLMPTPYCFHGLDNIPRTYAPVMKRKIDIEYVCDDFVEAE
jgi:hypothetical protein